VFKRLLDFLNGAFEYLDRIVLVLANLVAWATLSVPAPMWLRPNETRRSSNSLTTFALATIPVKPGKSH